MNRCDTMRELLPAYRDEELDAERRESVAAHLLECFDCETQLEAFDHGDRILRATLGAPVAVDDDFALSVWARIESEDRAAANAP